MITIASLDLMFMFLNRRRHYTLFRFLRSISELHHESVWRLGLVWPLYASFYVTLFQSLCLPNLLLPRHHCQVLASSFWAFSWALRAFEVFLGLKALAFFLGFLM